MSMKVIQLITFKIDFDKKCKENKGKFSIGLRINKVLSFILWSSLIKNSIKLSTIISPFFL